MSDVKLRVPAFPARLVARVPTPRPLIAAALVVVVALPLAWLPPLAALWLVFGAAVVGLVLVQPMAGVCLLPFAVGFGSLVYVTVDGVHIGPTDLLVAALALAWGARVLTASAQKTGCPRVSRVPSPQQVMVSLRAAWRREPLRLILYVALLAYLAAVTMSLAAASDRIETLKEILKWGEVVALVALGGWLLVDLARVRLLVWSVIAAGTLQAIVGLAQWARFVADGNGRVAGTFSQPNPLAGYLTFGLVLTVALVLFGPIGPDARARWLASAAGMLLVGGEVLARSRGAALGLGAGLVIIAVVGWRRERLLAWVAGIGVPLGAIAWVAHLIPLSLQQRVLDQVRLDDVSLCDRVNAANFSIQERLAQWAAGLRMFAAHPLLGVGAGNFDAAYARYHTWCWPDALGHAHDYYITAAAETGVIGLVAFLALTGMTFIAGAWASRSWPFWGAPTAPDESAGAGAEGSAASRPLAVVAQPAYGTQLARALAIGFFAAMVAIAVQNLTDDLFVHAMELQFALGIAALLRLGVLSRGDA